MGASGGAYFCVNGHLVDSWGHHEFSHFDYLPSDQRVCPHCGVPESQIKNDYEWGDSEYNPLVPSKPIRREKKLSDRLVTIRTDDGEEISGKEIIDVNIYDVSKLFKVI